MFCKFLGQPKLSQKEDLPEYQAAGLPFVDGSKDVLQVRFNWNATEKNKVNNASIMKIVTFILSHGSQYSSGAAPLLALITPGDMETRVCKKFATLRRIWRKGCQKEQTEAMDEDQENQDKTNKPVKEDRTKYHNRARGVRTCAMTVFILTNRLTDQKLEIRLRKRSALPDDSEWRLPKYNAAFVFQQMSDDETSKDNKNTFISQAPTSRSDTVCSFWLCYSGY